MLSQYLAIPAFTILLTNHFLLILLFCQFCFVLKYIRQTQLISSTQNLFNITFIYELSERKSLTYASIHSKISHIPTHSNTSNLKHNID